MSTSPPTDSLVALAARRQLPRHQYMDHATVRWIEANRPDFDTAAPLRLRSTSQRLLYRSAIPLAWLAEQRLANSVHGIRHAMRTAALAAVLAEGTLDEDETATLILASAVHDCRRLHDQNDHPHGERAALWLRGNADAVWRHFGLTVTPRRIDQAATAVRLHAIPYAAFAQDDWLDHAKAERISDLLKTADALDRYRLPKLSWWPNPAHLRTPDPDPDRMGSLAFDLVLISEAAHLAGMDSADAVFHALHRGRLIG